MATLFAMMHRAVLTFIVLVLLAPLALAPVALAQDGRFTVTGLAVSGSGDSVTQAQERAVRQALRDGFAAMLAGLGDDAAGVTPDQVSDGRIAGLVTALNATDETVGDGTYSATVNISFAPDGVLSLIDSLRPPPAPPASPASPASEAPPAAPPETEPPATPQTAAAPEPVQPAAPTPAQRPEAPATAPSGGQTASPAENPAPAPSSTSPAPPTQTAAAPVIRPPNPPLPGHRPAIPAGFGGAAQVASGPTGNAGPGAGGETVIPLPQVATPAAGASPTAVQPQPVVQPPAATTAAPSGVAAGGPVLLVALWRDDSGVYLWDSPNPWREAWLNFSRPSAPVEIIQPFGDIEDAVTVTAEQAASRTMPALTSLARRYGAAEILLAVARRGSGAVEIEIERMTTGGRTIAETVITAPGTELTAYYLGVEAVASWLMGGGSAAGTGLPPSAGATQPGLPGAASPSGGQLGTGTTSVSGISATVLPPPGQGATGQSATGQPATSQSGGIGLSGSAFTGGVAPGNSPTVGVLGSMPQGTPLPQVQQLEGLPGVSVATPGPVAAGPSYAAIVPIADRLDWTAIRGAMQQAPGVLAVNTLLVTQTRADVSIVFQGSEAELRSSLNSVGLDLGYNPSGVLEVRRR